MINLAEKEGAGEDGQKERLERLIREPVCPIGTAEKYSTELKKMGDTLFVEGSLKRGAKLFKALSDANRLKLLKLLKVRPMCVCELMLALGITQPTASHHLGILEEAGLVEGKRKGKWIFYELVNAEMLHLADRIIELREK